jgi:hypothetical protein
MTACARFLKRILRRRKGCLRLTICRARALLLPLQSLNANYGKSRALAVRIIFFKLAKT